MADIQEEADRIAREVAAAAQKVADAAATGLEQARDIARDAFDKIKVARERAEDKPS